MSEQAPKANLIFVSYRREDTAGFTGRIYDRLVQAFGRETIFKDVDSIPLGVNFRQHIDSMVAECAAVLVVIGDKWGGTPDKAGRRRLDDPGDFVRIEVESALRRNVPVIPLLVQGAVMPLEAELPSSLAELAYRNGMSIGYDPHFHTDMDRLIRSLESIVTTPARVASTPAPAQSQPTQAKDTQASRSSDHSTAGPTTTLPQAGVRARQRTIALSLLGLVVLLVITIIMLSNLSGGDNANNANTTTTTNTSSPAK